MMVMDLLAAQPVTPQELDDWLRSTEVQDEPMPQPAGETPPLPDLGPCNSPPLPPPPTETAETDRTSHQQRERRRRRSSLDCGVFGIDAMTALGRGHQAQQDAVVRMVSEGDIDLSSPTSSLSVPHEGVDRDAALATMGGTAPVFAMERHSSGHGGPRGDDDDQPRARDGGGGGKRTSSTVLSRRDSAGSGCSATCASSDTVPVRNNISRSVTDDAAVSPLAPARAPAMHRANTGAGSPFRKAGDGSPPGSYCRSVSLPGNGHSGRQRFEAILHHSQSLPAPVQNTQRRHSNLEQQASVRDLAQFLSAMERSQKSQDYIHSGAPLQANSRRSLASMRETNRSRGLLLSVLSGAASAASGVDNVGAHHRGANGGCYDSSRRTSASQVIAAHNSAHPNRRASTPSNAIGANMRQVVRNRRASAESWRQRDAKNMMLRSVQMNKEEAMMTMNDRDMMMMMNRNSSRSLGCNWRPVPKHRSFTAQDHPREIQHHSDKHNNKNGMICPEEDLDQEGLVKAELRRIAREQMMEMERQERGQQRQQQQLQSIY